MVLTTSFMVFARSRQPKRALLALLSLGLLSSCIHKKYETPITKNTQQPDKVLFDQAMRDIEHGRYEVARISLQTLMNTYESSEFLAKSKLAIADSWFREGGANGLGQAEAEYKDFELFYPQMEESAQAQSRVCDIHYKQMDKSDRDELQTVAAERECKDLITQYPNSKFVPAGLQKLRDIQESMAEHEFAVGNFYWRREMNPAAANRLNSLVDQYPLYSKAGESLFEAGDAYSKMGPRFRKDAGEEFARIVRDYPLDPRAKDAKDRLTEMELPIPAADAAALKRQQWEKENYHKPGMMAKSTGILKGGPDLQHSAKSGAPTMTDPQRTLPKSIPVANNGEVAANGAAPTGNTDVSATPVSGGDSALDKKPDARTPEGAAAATTPAATTPAATSPAAPATTPAAPASTAPLPTNRDKDIAKMRELQAKKQKKLDKKKKKDTAAPAPIAPDPSAVPGAATTPATPPTTTPKS
jgi:outer membrane protein assembly factor BamD